MYFSFKVNSKSQCGVWVSLPRIICMKTNQVEQKKVKTLREVPIKIIKALRSVSDQIDQLDIEREICNFVVYVVLFKEHRNFQVSKKCVEYLPRGQHRKYCRFKKTASEA